jgi:predicted  nucleic acid-binding Zn-ribbon protein
MQHTVQRLANDLETRKHKISISDMTAFSIEQECKRIEQRVQELTTQKGILESLIASILSDDNEGYSS